MRNPHQQPDQEFPHPKVTVVIPAYNEKDTVGQTLSRVLASSLVSEIIIVDDGSTDGTTSIIRQMAKSESRVHALFHERNLGKGAALLSAFQHVHGDYIIIQDADLEYDPRDYPALLEPLLDGRADVVYGSRFLGGPHRVLFFWHYVGNKVLTTFCNALCDLNLTDMETGYKAFRREVLQSLSLKARDFTFEPEFTVKVARRGFRIYEVPISYSGRTYSEGKKITWKDGLKALLAVVRYRFFDSG